MAGQAFWIKADRRLLTNLRTLGPKIAGKITRESARAAAKEVLAVLKPMLPKKTGATRKLARVRAMKRKKGRIGFNVLIANKGDSLDTFYAPFVDLGTTRIQARRNVRKAFEKSDEKAAETMREGIRRGISRAVNGG